MPRKVSLLSLLQDFRAEVRASSNPAHNANVRESQVVVLRRTQETLWEQVDWPFLRVERFTETQAGQRYMAPPADLPLERIEKVEVRSNGRWCDLGFGIDARHISMRDSDEGERDSPALRWDIHEDEQIEIWPVPDVNSARYDDPKSPSIEGRLRFTGIRALRPLVDDEDTCDLDSRLITLHAAAETLSANGAPDAALKDQAAARLLKSLTANWSKIKSYKLGGASTPEPRRPRPPHVQYRERG